MGRVLGVAESTFDISHSRRARLARDVVSGSKRLTIAFVESISWRRILAEGQSSYIGNTERACALGLLRVASRRIAPAGNAGDLFRVRAVAADVASATPPRREKRGFCVGKIIYIDDIYIYIYTQSGRLVQSRLGRHASKGRVVSEATPVSLATPTSTGISQSAVMLDFR